MNLFILTGVSKGLGHSFANVILENENNYLIGISRNNPNIENKNFKYINCDLSNIRDLINKFDNIFLDGSFEKTILINNAASLGELNNISSLENYLKIENTINLNITSSVILCSEFIKRYKNSEKYVLNITSGIATRDIEGLSIYGISKIALDKFTRILEMEELDTYVRAISPGLIETPLQKKLRTSTTIDASPYKNAYDEGIVNSTEDVSKKILDSFLNKKINEVISHVKDI